jgi:hypothetical protein
MSPEQLIGRLPRNPSDIYAFGMTLFEVSSVTPSGNTSYKFDSPLDIHRRNLGHIGPGEFIQLVTQHDVRPEPPYEVSHEAPQLTDAVWWLAAGCSSGKCGVL